MEARTGIAGDTVRVLAQHRRAGRVQYRRAGRVQYRRPPAVRWRGRGRAADRFDRVSPSPPMPQVRPEAVSP